MTNASRLPAANVGNTERLWTMLVGAALLRYAWRNGSKGLGLASAGLIARGATGYCPGYAALGVTPADTRDALSGGRGIHIRESIRIHASAEEIYRYWRQLERLPEVMPHLERVEQLDGVRSRWTAKVLDALPVQWDAEIINDIPNATIGWKTLAGQAMHHAGSVTFKPDERGRGTEVRVHLQYAALGGRAASWLAWLAGEDPARLTRDGLRQLRRRLEGAPGSEIAGTPKHRSSATDVAHEGELHGWTQPPRSSRG